MNVFCYDKDVFKLFVMMAFVFSPAWGVPQAGIPVPQETQKGIRTTPAPKLDSVPVPRLKQEITPKFVEKSVSGMSAAQERSRPAGFNRNAHISSESGVFSVSGATALRVGAIATLADGMRKKLCKLLELPDAKSIPIGISLEGEHEDSRKSYPIRMSIDLMDGEPIIRIIVHCGGGIDVTALQKRIIEACLYEFALRGINVDSFEGRLEIAPFLVAGIQQVILWRAGKIDRQIYEDLFERTEMLSPEEILNLKEPWNFDASTRQVYDMSCSVLILGLLEQPQGASLLRDLLEDSLTNEAEPKELLQKHFHELSISDNALSKWWALELVKLALPKLSEVMPPAETEERLQEALIIHYFDIDKGIPAQISFEDVHALMALPKWKQLLSPVVAKLNRLNVRSFPGYRPFILEYIRAIGILRRDEDADEIHGILGPLRELRENYAVTAKRARDYLDWYEITHLGNTARASFNAYLDAMSLLRKNTREKPTAMSHYLRDIEELHQLGVDDEFPESLQKKLNQIREDEKSLDDRRAAFEKI